MNKKMNKKRRNELAAKKEKKRKAQHMRLTLGEEGKKPQQQQTN